MTAEVSRMPKVTLYVKDADAQIWERARQLAGDSLSSVVSRALAAYVGEQETKSRAKTERERESAPVTLDVEPDEGPSRKVRFTGMLAHEGGGRPGDPDVYVTTSGKVIVADNEPTYRGPRVVDVHVFEGYEEFLSSNPSEEAGAAVAEALGEEWIEEIE